MIMVLWWAVEGSTLTRGVLMEMECSSMKSSTLDWGPLWNQAVFSHILRMVEVSGNGLHNVILKITLGQSAWNILITSHVYMPQNIMACHELWIHWLFHFRALSVILYLAFLFMVVIVLLNVLIAQVSDTYTKVLATAPEVYLSHQCWYMARIEEQRYAAYLPCVIPRMLRWCVRKIAGPVSYIHTSNVCNAM